MSGALDGLGANRRQMLQSADLMMNRISEEHRRNVDGQVGFFDLFEEEGEQEITLPPVEEFSAEQLLEMEKQTTGLYITGHPLMRLEKTAKLLKCTRISDILAAEDAETSLLKDGSAVKVLAIIASVTRKHLRNGSDMAFLTVEDAFGSMETVVFAGLYERYKEQLAEGKIVLLEGKISLREDEEAKLLLSKLVPYDKSRFETVKAKLYLRLPTMDCAKTKQAKDILAGSAGNCAVYFYYTDTGTYENLRQPQGFLNFESIEADKLGELLGEENVVFRL